MVNVKIDTGALILALENLPRELNVASENGLDAVADFALKQKQREIEKTYRRPVPVSTSGKPKWKRSGNWKDEQTIAQIEGARIVVAEGDSANYEARLAELPAGKDGINRTNPAAQNARDSIEKRAIALMESEIKKALKL